MATEAALISRIRSELGDFEQPFRTTYRGDGATDLFDLPATNVSGAVVTVFDNGGATTIPPDDYTLDSRDGILDLDTAPDEGVTIMVEGTTTGLFTDTELGLYLHDALLQHTHGATTRVRYRDTDGFVRYSERPVTLENLPEVEELLVVILATVEALWALSTDASTDIDVSTAEGTFVGRSQRYAQIRSQIDVLTEKYLDLSQQLNVGLHRIEVTNLRRVSRLTGRLVPLYVEREFDDYSWPERIIPPIDSQHSERDTGVLDDDVSVVDFTITAGDTFVREVDLGFDLTGATVKASITGWNYRYYGVQTFAVEVTDAVNGLFKISLTPTQTASLGPGAQYDVEVTEADGTVTTWVKGHIWFDPQITLSGTVGQVAVVTPYNIPGWTVQDLDGI